MNQADIEKEIAILCDPDFPVTDFIATPIAESLIVDPGIEDTPDEVAQRQKNMDIFIGWNSRK